jgi:tRNA(His) guanylyltransferase
MCDTITTQEMKTMGREDTLGDRCKSFEGAETARRADPTRPLLARLDGRSFHTFTRGLDRPYDLRLSKLMNETARYLVSETHAAIAYTQSDEITLAWPSPSTIEGKYMFDGKLQKLTSVLAGMCSARFQHGVDKLLPDKAEQFPHFDCRVWQVPDLWHAAEVFMWREDDAVKNAISMAAQAHYSSKALHGVNSKVKLEMLQALGQPFERHPRFFRRGTYLQKENYQALLTEEQRLKIPETHRPKIGETVTRSRIVELNLPPLRQIENLLTTLFTPERS